MVKVHSINHVTIVLLRVESWPAGSETIPRVVWTSAGFWTSWPGHSADVQSARCLLRQGSYFI